METRSVPLLVGALALLAVGTAAHASVSIDSPKTADELVSNLLGSGITIVPGSPNYLGAPGAAGFFTNGAASGLGIDSGIILTTGSAGSAQGANSADDTTGDNGLPGDTDLEAILPAGGSTFDATVLEFDFTSAGGDVLFRYVFASEEYNEWINMSYNDVFGFFLDGVNVARIPGTTIPVSIDTVNGGDPPGVNAAHPEFFHNNDLDDGGPSFDFEYDGFTDVFTAQGLDLSSGTHHIKLAIADTSDPWWDSAVLLEAGTFSDIPTPPDAVPAPGTIFLCALGTGLVGWLRHRKML